MRDPDLSLLCDAARAAGEISSRYWRRAHEAWEKPGSAGPVTEADLAVDRMLHEELTAARPDYGWLSEESEDAPQRLAKSRVFIVDPIDGTRAFMAGEDTYSHSLAIAEHGRIVAAAVFVPQLGALYTAAEDVPAMLNGASIAVSQMTGLEGATLLAANPVMAAGNWRDAVPPVKRVFRASIAYRLCLVAEGRFDAMMALRDSWEWDIAAGDLIVRKAGGVVSDRHGREVTFNAPYPRAKGLIAAPGALHAKLLDALQPVEATGPMA